MCQNGPRRLSDSASCSFGLGRYRIELRNGKAGSTEQSVLERWGVLGSWSHVVMQDVRVTTCDTFATKLLSGALNGLGGALSSEVVTGFLLGLLQLSCAELVAGFLVGFLRGGGPMMVPPRSPPTQFVCRVAGIAGLIPSMIPMGFEVVALAVLLSIPMGFLLLFAVLAVIMSRLFVTSVVLFVAVIVIDFSAWIPILATAAAPVVWLFCTTVFVAVGASTGEELQYWYNIETRALSGPRALTGALMAVFFMCYQKWS